MRFTSALRSRDILVVVLLGLAGCGTGEQPVNEPFAEHYQPTTLLEAVLLGDRPAVERFLANGADVNAAEPDGTTPLMRAIHGQFPTIAVVLINAGADVSAANTYGVTPLYIAARITDAESTRALLRAGANANTALPEGETVLMTAARAGSADIVRSLLAGGTSASALNDLVPVETADVQTAGYGSVVSPVRRTNRADVNAHEGWYGQTALMWAAAAGHADIVRILLEAGANVDEHSHAIDTPRRNLESTYGNVDYPKGGLTALHFAAREGQREAVQALIDGGADLDAVDEEGANALIFAVTSGHLDIATLLLEAGADPNVADTYGRTVLFAAADWNPGAAAAGDDIGQDGSAAENLAKLALAKGANPDAALTKALPSYLVQGGEQNALLNRGATPLFRAAMSGDLELVELLLDAGADPLAATAARAPVTVGGVEQPANGGTTTFMAAAGVGWQPALSRGRESDVLRTLELLLERGADVNAANQQGDTALHGATLRGSTAIIQFLADRGANLRAKNVKGQTALDIAMGVPEQRIPYNEAATNLLRRLQRA